jgi:hypothetical protein
MPKYHYPAIPKPTVINVKGEMVIYHFSTTLRTTPAFEKPILDKKGKRKLDASGQPLLAYPIIT